MIPVLLAVLSAAHAEKDQAPYMWGVGPQVGTVIVPFSHPVAFPKVGAGEQDGEVVKESLGDSLEKTSGDALLGAKGTLYINGSNRLLASAGLGFGGGGYRSAEATFEYQGIPVSGGGVDAFLGGGLGLGSLSWSSYCSDSTVDACPDEIPHPGKLTMSTLLLRGSVGALYRNKTQAYELSMFGHFVVAGNRRFTPQGTTTEEEVYGAGVYSYLGVAGTVYFGDLTPPGQGKKGKKGKKAKKA